MKDCAQISTLVDKRDKFSLKQCPKNDLEGKEMQNIPYVSAIGSLMYAKVCTLSDSTFIMGMFSRYSSIPEMDHWIPIKRVMRFLQGTKDYMLVYRKSENLEIIGYSDSDLAGCVDKRKSTFGYFFMSKRYRH